MPGECTISVPILLWLHELAVGRDEDFVTVDCSPVALFHYAVDGDRNGIIGLAEKDEARWGQYAAEGH